MSKIDATFADHENNFTVNRFHPELTEESTETDPEVSEKMQKHRLVLKSVGIEEIGSLGKLLLSGNNITQPGVLIAWGASVTPVDDIADPLDVIPESRALAARPSFEIETYSEDEGMIEGSFYHAYRINPTIANKEEDSVTFELMGGDGHSPQTVELSPLLQNLVPINTAYWVAKEIYLQDGTNVIFKHPNKFLVIITEKLEVGRNVTFTWERGISPVVKRQLPKPTKKPKPPQAQSPPINHGTTGAHGDSGIPGNTGENGKDAPELELWVLQMVGAPAFDIRGEDGSMGQQGQDGGDGGNGGIGSRSISGKFQCQHGPGSGGNGGNGGPAGRGGNGGDGGNGGRLSLFAPQAVLTTYTAGGFYITVDGGTPGPGGPPGLPGEGGKGGEIGEAIRRCSQDGKSPGEPGHRGQPSEQGSPGRPGGRYGDAITLKVITQDDFMKELEKPAIISLSSIQAKEGDTISIYGLRFSKGNFVLVDNNNCLTNYISDSLLTFVVPSSEGGRRAVQVSRGGASAMLSNRATLDVMPVIHSYKPNGRVKPGSIVTLVGTGFADGAKVQVNDQDMPDFQFINLNAIQFRMVRPEVVSPNPAGEVVSVKVILREGETSNKIELVLDTFVLLVLGDSIEWGEGLQEPEKFYSLVEKEIRNKLGNIGVYKDVQAHCGAVIGLAFRTDQEDTNICDPVKEDGEVPTDYPTILQQVDNYTMTPPEMVDLIVMDGGINDVGLSNILDPLRDDPPLHDLIENHCHHHMKILLNKITNKFTKANIVVTGYYKIVTKDSFRTSSPLRLIKLIIQAFGGAVTGIIIAEAAESEMIRKSNVFATESKEKLQQAVDEVNQQFGGITRIFYADPQFQDVNSIFASNPLVFGIYPNLNPQDTMQKERSESCDAARPHRCAGSQRTWEAKCKRASTGHPNSGGARKYADAIINTGAL